MNPPRLRLLRTVVAGTLMTAAAFGPGCRKRDPAPEAAPLPAVPVRVVLVESATRVVHEEVVGTVQSKLRAALEPRVSARIESYLVAPGQTVSAGQLLAQLDAREIQARLDQAVAVREQAAVELERSRTLLQQQGTARAEFDVVQARERVALGALREAEAMLGHTKIVAPFDGLVTRKLADVGDLATPGRPIAEMENPHALRFEANVPESLIGNIALRDRLAVRIGTSPVGTEGDVVELAPVADPASRTFLVKLDLPTTDGLRSGQFGRVLVPTGESRSIFVPVSALVARGQMETVFVVFRDQAQLRLVRTGKSTGTHVEVLAGLTSGESVVSSGAEHLRDGQPVTVQP